ncbi:hypothetical protein BDV41DRAFT_520947 [Aspergillus transmontanensis]|uniref:STB6-like N-terminal domain-containing protein n=1 Tax=Aspergillus transmontanensis TaxID=1034304 RepID=A0A5N6WEI2_9EURO|nr:hypothetical protein BDV41DRAFT_520947 [Aspergillus transmontanensis]
MSQSATQHGAQAAPSTSTMQRETTKQSVGPKESPSSHNGPNGQPPLPGHQRIVFTDPVALRYLEEDPSTIVLHRRLILQGYEIYIVEQWACSRIHPTFIITTYTGEPSHTVVAGLLSVPTNESTWSPRLKLYFDAVAECEARRKETPFGTLFITDLNTFPSALTVIPVPDGDIHKHKDDFIVNENLKRLNCSGRAGLKLQPPTAATEAKFYHLYRTSERVPLYSAVIELVKQCQIALMMFGNLAPEYVDGVLCDVTEAAIGDWWTDIGMDLYNIEPSDGVLGPTTVAALLGTLMGARNRLHAFGAPVGKDAFDISNLKRGISSFQKSQKLKRTRRLDRQTLDRLHRVTAKAANAEGWTDAVKSTMAELSGHGGEMVMGMVRGREKGGIADIETLDVDNFAHLVTGERAKWLWRGKPRKGGVGDSFAGGHPGADMMFTTDDQGGYLWTSRKRSPHDDLIAERSYQGSERPGKPLESGNTLDDKDQNIGRLVRRGVSGKVSDARAGFGRFKDAVGLRSHLPKTKDDTDLLCDAAYIPPLESDTEIAPSKIASDGGRQPEPESVPDNEMPTQSHELSVETPLNNLVPKSSDVKLPAITIESVASNEPSDGSRKVSLAREDEESQDLEQWKTRSTDAPAEDQTSEFGIMSLRRPQSSAELYRADDTEHLDNYWPRHLSFSTIEEVILGWEDLKGKVEDSENPDASLEEAIAEEDMLVSDARIFSSRVQGLSEGTVPWVEKQVGSVDDLNRVFYETHERVNTTYLEKLNHYQGIRERSSDLLSEEHSSLTDHMRRVEMMSAKLDYELNVLGSKVEEVETGLGEFERHIEEIETRVKTLIRGEEEKQNCSWLARLGRFTGFSS